MITAVQSKNQKMKIPSVLENLHKNLMNKGVLKEKKLKGHGKFKPETDIPESKGNIPESKEDKVESKVAKLESTGDKEDSKEDKVDKLVKDISKKSIVNSKSEKENWKKA